MTEYKHLEEKFRRAQELGGGIAKLAPSVSHDFNKTYPSNFYVFIHYVFVTVFSGCAGDSAGKRRNRPKPCFQLLPPGEECLEKSRRSDRRSVREIRD